VIFISDSKKLGYTVFGADENVRGIVDGCKKFFTKCEGYYNDVLLNY
jgi:hypothetical protein